MAKKLEGSEEIFESFVEEKILTDDPLNGVESKESENILIDHLNPKAAFEYFHGKIYDLPQRTEYSLVDKVEKRVESPFQRYTRLRFELQELQNDVQVMLQETNKSRNHQGMWSTLHEETAQLVKNLDIIDPQIKELSNQINNSSTTDLTKLSSSTIESTSTNNSSRDINLLKTGSIDSNYLRALELRVASLESLIGSASNTLDVEGVVGVSITGRSYPLLDKLTSLERKVNLFDAGTLESIRGKAHTLKLELEEIQRERLRAGGATHKILESVKKVEILHEKVNQAVTLSDDLPTILLRLKTLESLHHEAASFNVQLTNLTETTTQLKNEIDANSEILETLKKGFAENMSVVQKNITEISQRQQK